MQEERRPDESSRDSRSDRSNQSSQLSDDGDQVSHSQSEKSSLYQASENLSKELSNQKSHSQYKAKPKFTRELRMLQAKERSLGTTPKKSQKNEGEKAHQNCEKMDSSQNIPGQSQFKTTRSGKKISSEQKPRKTIRHYTKQEQVSNEQSNNISHDNPSKEQLRQDDSDESQSPSVSVMYGHFKLSKNRRYAYCLHCQQTLEVDKYLALNLSLHVKTKHPSKIQGHFIKTPIDSIHLTPPEDPNFHYPKFIPPPEGRRSLAWDKFLYNKQLKIAICKTCQQTFFCHDGSTSTLVKHLRAIQKEKLVKPRSRTRNRLVSVERLIGREESKEKDGRRSEGFTRKQASEQSKMDEEVQQKVDERPKTPKFNPPKSAHPPRQADRPPQPVHNKPPPAPIALTFQKRPSRPQPQQRRSVDIRAQIIFQQPAKVGKFQLYQKLAQKGITDRLQCTRIIEKHYWASQNKYPALFRKLKKHKNTNVIENAINTEIANVCILTQEMIGNYREYGECLSIWIRESEIMDKNITDFLYFTVQSRCGLPVVVALAIMFKNNIESLKLVLQTVSNEISMSSRCLTICAEAKFIDMFQTILNKSFLKTTPIKQVLYLDNKNQRLTSNSSTQFHGLLETKQFRASIRQLLINKYQSQTKLTRWLLYFLRKAAYLDSRKNLPQQLTPAQLLNLDSLSRQSFDDQQLLALSNTLSKQVFFQLLSVYRTGRFFCRLYHNLNQQLQCSVSQIDPSLLHLYTEQQVYNLRYNQIDKHWQCQCGLLSRVGLPCPHLVFVVRRYGGSLGYYVNSRWVGEHGVRVYGLEELRGRAEWYQERIGGRQGL